MRLIQKNIPMLKRRNDKRRNPYTGLLLTAAAVLVYLAVCALYLPGMKTGPLKLRTIDMHTADAGGGMILIQSDTAQSSTGSGHRAQAEPDTTPKRVLFFGDSMAEGLTFPMGRYAAANGHDLTTVIWYGSTTQTWAECDTLASLINRYDPQFLIVSLGGNELFVKDLPERDSYIKKILSTVGGRDYIWIGPPNWRPDTGINRLIRENTGEDRFFDSSEMTFQRSQDGRHPTRHASVLWADSIASWIRHKPASQLRMQPPPEGTEHKMKIIILPVQQ